MVAVAPSVSLTVMAIALTIAVVVTVRSLLRRSREQELLNLRVTSAVEEPGPPLPLTKAQRKFRRRMYVSRGRGPDGPFIALRERRAWIAWDSLIFFGAFSALFAIQDEGKIGLAAVLLISAGSVIVYFMIPFLLLAVDSIRFSADGVVARSIFLRRQVSWDQITSIGLRFHYGGSRGFPPSRVTFSYRDRDDSSGERKLTSIFCVEHPTDAQVLADLVRPICEDRRVTVEVLPQVATRSRVLARARARERARARSIRAYRREDARRGNEPR